MFSLRGYWISEAVDDRVTSCLSLFLLSWLWMFCLLCSLFPSTPSSPVIFCWETLDPVQFMRIPLHTNHSPKHPLRWSICPMSPAQLMTLVFPEGQCASKCPRSHTDWATWEIPEKLYYISNNVWKVLRSQRTPRICGVHRNFVLWPWSVLFTSSVSGFKAVADWCTVWLFHMVDSSCESKCHTVSTGGLSLLVGGQWPWYYWQWQSEKSSLTGPFI